MSKQVDIDFRDYKEVHEYLVQEKLTTEELAEGLEPEEMIVKLGVTGHAYKRIYDTFGRQCEWASVEDLFLSKAHKLFAMKTGEDFVIMNETNTLALVCNMFLHEGLLVVELFTVIRKVIIVNNREVEQPVKMKAGIVKL